MESLKSFHDRIRNVQSQGKKIIEARVALNARLTQEETRLKREDEVSTLIAVRCAIVEQLQWLKHAEASASCAHSQANLVLFPVGLFVTAMVSKRNRMSALTDYLLHGSADRQQPFGLVMVCIGLKGVPDDARAVSISQLARDSHRPETEIMNKLQEDGYLLFAEEVFSSLIDKLVADVRQGKLRLPISREKLVEIVRLSKPKSRIKIVPIE
jgi:hypothetical protein